MAITKECIGNVVCRYDNGEHLMVNNVSGNLVFFQHENGAHGCAPAADVNGTPENDLKRVNSFHRNLSLTRVLEAADRAGKRRLALDNFDAPDKEEAARVCALAKEQRDEIDRRIQAERQGSKAGSLLANRFLSELSQGGEGACAVFFGTPVHYCGGPGQVFIVNEEMALSREEAMAFLGELTAAPPARSVSLANLLADALARASQQMDGEVHSSSRSGKDDQRL